QTVSAGANLLLRAGTPRLLGFVGMGLAEFVTTEWEVRELICTPLIAGGCDGARNESAYQSNHSGSSWNFLGGVDVPVAGRVAAFAEVRAGTAPREGIRAVFGGRLTVR